MFTRARNSGDILIIDDSIEVQLMLQIFLVEEGYIVHLANHAHEATDLLTHYLPDLILLDISLPQINGYELCEQLKNNPLTATIPIIFISAYSETLDKVRAFQIGGVDYLTKTMPLAEISIRIKTQIHLHRLQTDLHNQNLQLKAEILRREQAEQYLKEQQKILTHLLNSLTGIAYYSHPDIQRQLLFASEGFTAVTGYDLPTFLNNNDYLNRLIHPADYEKVHTALHTALTEDKPYEIEYRLITATGETRCVWDQGYGVKDKTGSLSFISGLALDITTRYQTEERLRLLETVILNTNDLVMITESHPVTPPGPKIVFVNDAILHIAGYHPEELIGKDPRILQGKDTQVNELKKISQALQAEQPVQVELINYRKTGEPYWIDIRILPIHNPAGEITHFAAIERDITTHKQIETNLLKREFYLTSVVEIQKQLLAGEATDTTLQRILKRLCHISGADEGILFNKTIDAQGQTTATLKYHWHKHPIKTPLNTLTFTKLNPYWLDALQRSDGPILATTTEMPYYERRLLQKIGIKSFIAFPIHIQHQFAGIITLNHYTTNHLIDSLEIDILWAAVSSISAYLDSKRNADELKRLNKEMTSVNYIGQIVSNVQDLQHILEKVAQQITYTFNIYNTIITVFDAEKKEIKTIIDYLNHHISNKNKLTITEIPAIIQIIHTKKYISINRQESLSFAPPLYHYIQDNNIHQTIFTPLIIKEEVTGIIILFIKEEKRLFNKEDFILIETISRQISGALENARLFNEEQYQRYVAQKQAEELWYAKQAAEAANRAKSTFLANMSHEFRTPLNAILGYTQILSTDKKFNVEHRNDLAIIKRCGEHLLNLISDILDVAKIEAGKLELLPTNFHLPNFLKEITELFRLRAEQKNIKFIYKQEYNLNTNDTKNATFPIIIHADNKRLRQILLNLLSNAIKFTDKGEVHFKVSYANNTLFFNIKDTGVGIPDDKFEAIFSPFEQVGEPNRRIEGSGLGLTITRNLVELMQGHLNVSSEMSKGSHFWFSVPIVVMQSSAFDPQHPHLIPHTPIGYRCTQQEQCVLSIWIVDDIVENQILMKDLLKPLGFDIQLFDSATDLLDNLHIAKINNVLPALILLDLKMPEMDGFMCAHYIRQELALTDLIIIALSAQVFEEDIKHSFKVGCHDFLPKPIQIETLFNLLEKYLNIQWVYNSTDTIENSKNAAIMVKPSASQCEQLYRIVDSGDIRGILDYLAALEEKNPALQGFVKEARQLAQSFDMDELEALVEQCRQSGK